MENTWLTYCVWSLLILPWGLAFLMVLGIMSVIGTRFYELTGVDVSLRLRMGHWLCSIRPGS
jgi:hypothetical protein